MIFEDLCVSVNLSQHGIYDMHIHLSGVPFLEWEPSPLLSSLHAKYAHLQPSILCNNFPPCEICDGSVSLLPSTLYQSAVLSFTAVTRSLYVTEVCRCRPIHYQSAVLSFTVVTRSLYVLCRCDDTCVSCWMSVKR